MAATAEYRVLPTAGPPIAYRKSATLIIAAACDPATTVGGYDYKVCMLRRSGTGSFKNAVVFPGGAREAVDDVIARGTEGGPTRDGRADVPLSPNPLDTAAMKVCAVREAFEEAGAQVFTSRVDAGAWRDRVMADSQACLAMLKETGTAFAVDRLQFWCSFTTPDVEARRMKKGGFETAFYVTVMDDGIPLDMACCERETKELLWLTPAEALDQYAAGELLMIAPQWTVLREMTNVKTRASLLSYAENPSRTLFRDHVTKPYVLIPQTEAAKAKGVWAAFPGDALHPLYPHPGGVHRVRLRPTPCVRQCNLPTTQAIAMVAPKTAKL